MRHLIQTNTSNPRHFAVHSSVMMPKEAHARLNARYQVGEAGSFAHEFTAPVPRVSHPRGCVVRQHNIDGALTGLA
jgi:hypothetical protein